MDENKAKAVIARRGQHATLLSDILKGLDEEQQHYLLAICQTDILAMLALLPEGKATGGKL